MIVVLIVLASGMLTWAAIVGNRRHMRAVDAAGYQAGLMAAPLETCPCYFASYGNNLRDRGVWMSAYARGMAERK